ncbi:DeoR/GlpR family DNA-binding transcription regulator [Sediminibacterium soli]|uniref:DeoR/GlpR family DNA-binding transcription regulator n=1 Tax=Sediminibacterium soli TaxID=2698829 RepID=UPI0013795067|nr:DeoR/GlpR family DNA-binding transcription regulator [Sediminibacterium soli]NCI46634.1 DeoR/GlpR transcriptional regulator [Sediminibacterium soli]
MLKKERQAYILHQVSLHNSVLSADLSHAINVSEDTIRRDLNELADDGKLIKVHGGALSKSFNSFYLRSDVYNVDNKKRIAEKAVSMIKDGMFVITGGGTTIIEMARLLPEDLKATFFTGSIPAAYEYSQHPNIELIFIGDKIAKKSQIAVGGEAINRIRHIKADLCFLGINAIDIQHGVTDNDWDIVQVKKAMIESASQTAVMSISEKLNTTQRVRVCGISEIDVLITELEQDAPQLHPFREAGLPIL